VILPVAREQFSQRCPVAGLPIDPAYRVDGRQKETYIDYEIKPGWRGRQIPHNAPRTATNSAANRQPQGPGHAGMIAKQQPGIEARSHGLKQHLAQTGEAASAVLYAQR
jgi:hypothetical protein